MRFIILMFFLIKMKIVYSRNRNLPAASLSVKDRVRFVNRDLSEIVSSKKVIVFIRKKGFD